MSSPASQHPEAVPAVVVLPAAVTTVADAVPPADGDWRDLDALDRSWAGVTYTRSVARIDMPGPERVRAALLSMAVAAPEIGRWVTTDQLRWRPVRPDEWDQWLEHTFAGSDDADADLDRIAILNSDRPRWTQFRVVAGPGWLSVRMHHSAGDGWTVDSFLGALLHRAAVEPSTAAFVPPWTVLPGRERDRVIRREVRTHLRSVLWAVRHRTDLAGGVYEEVGEDVAHGRERVLEVVSPDDFPRAIRALRDELYPGVSAAAVGIVALRSALAAVLPTPRPGFECLFNTRREAAGTATAWGNYSAGVYIRPSDDYDPTAVAAEMQRVRASGLPEIAHASLRLRGRTATEVVRMTRREGAPRLTMSYMQAHTVEPVLAGLRRGETRVQTISRPNGAESITVQQVECAGRVHVGAAFFPHVWDAALIESALAAFFADPRACLHAGRGRVEQS